MDNLATVVARTHEALKRIENDPTDGVWIERRSPTSVLADAHEVDSALKRGDHLPLAGLTVAVKNNIDVEGIRTTAAHPSYGSIADVDAEAVARLRNAGAIIIGSTNMDQFATGLVGTRSPYGALESATHPGRIAGGSSSGSAVATARGLVDIALGTDTAGSGRVPAALNGIVGVKCTRGVIPTSGVVPASRSYDCVTVFARDVTTAATATSVIAGPSRRDPLSRTWTPHAALAAPAAPTVAIPRDEDLESLDPERLAAFAAAAHRLRDRGARLVTLDISGLLEAAKLLYGGAIAAERAAAYGEFLTEHPEGADPVVQTIASSARRHNAVAFVNDTEKLDLARTAALQLLEGTDALLIPTTPIHPTLAEVAADPIETNSRIGTFTNFMNLLDLCGVAVPAHDTRTGNFGVTIVARAFEDHVALDLAAQLTGEQAPPRLFTGAPLAVFGAHLSGQPLNYQLTDRGAILEGTIATSSQYKMVALPGEMARPGVAPVSSGKGTSIHGELWRVPPSAWAPLIADVREPLALGPIELLDGSIVTGFVSTSMEGTDISAIGDWRTYLNSQPAT
ncbi:allophanate hydrolase [Demequina sediminicola]|uniref:allophanate hydrolase n=1 Tax=Demequina sediminicola TaxID=1095026 RepID=UPI000AA2E2C7|nr:allophanate hydrolase [Demequina sediminicola]